MVKSEKSRETSGLLGFLSKIVDETDSKYFADFLFFELILWQQRMLSFNIGILFFNLYSHIILSSYIDSRKSKFFRKSTWNRRLLKFNNVTIKNY